MCKRHTLRGFALAVAAAALAGCSRTANTAESGIEFGRGERDTVISGNVTVNGRPLTTGAVVFVGSNGPVGQGVVMPDGVYRAGMVPEGAVKVVYSSRALPPEKIRQVMRLRRGAREIRKPADIPPPSAEALKTAKAVESRYGNPDKTPLNYTVTRGPQTFDLNFVISE